MTTTTTTTTAANALPEYELHQDDMMVAGTSGKNAWREILHYAAQYEQDGPVEIYEVVRRKVDAAAELVAASAPTVPAQTGTQFAWFQKVSEFGPWRECNPSAPGAVRFFSAAPVEPVQAPDLTAALQRMRSAFHTNMLRAFPDKSHEEIAAEIDRACGLALSVQAQPVASDRASVIAECMALCDQVIESGCELKAGAIACHEALEDLICAAPQPVAVPQQQNITRMDIMSLIRQQCHRVYASAIDREDIDTKYMQEIEDALRGALANSPAHPAPVAVERKVLLQQIVSTDRYQEIARRVRAAAENKWNDVFQIEMAELIEHVVWRATNSAPDGGEAA